MPIEWTTKYSVSRASVGRIGDVVVAWSNDRERKGYDVSAFGVRLKEPSPDVEHGKARAISLARRLLAEAAAVLEPETVQ